ncbi:hypothetical protein BDY21DRAFT_333794 [Lineolata rhizophorae]|uniref:Dihydroorotate dehydrogenase (fumarate) n=1 Tax=Lineolata rhizophorae TaxID=578093 RepID=A0A6A6PA97_9PEZI|nr:hypothetical protein BDY21DRAFT_333794 [Lineolata rhizophorae]
MGLVIDPPLLNSANPWATTYEDLRSLYETPYSGAVTTRTSLLEGFPHDPVIHQYTFFNPSTHDQTANKTKPEASTTASLNTLGYSPITLPEYLEFIKRISDEQQKLSRNASKSFIISVTGGVEDTLECYRLITQCQSQVSMPLAMEINLSCPNIPNKPPPAYSGDRLTEYLSALKPHASTTSEAQSRSSGVPIGIKTPPYTYMDQFNTLVKALVKSASGEAPCPVSFITATNTLGSSLVLADDSTPVIASANKTGIGGLAGPPLHPLALGNVHTLRDLLSKQPELAHVQIIGVGGVEDAAGFARMRKVGASAVGVGTALGRYGVDVFEKIIKGMDMD